MKQKILSLVVASFTLACAVSCTNLSTSATNLKAVQFRIARPTNNLTEVVTFYEQALGLKVLGKFKDHSGYDGVMLGMPGKAYHLEFTQHVHKMPLPPPTKENLLVFYYDQPIAYKQANERIQKTGRMPVEPENPYWKDKSETYEDPDGWRVILFNGVYNP